jgi:hypothetical protein
MINYQETKTHILAGGAKSYTFNNELRSKEKWRVISLPNSYRNQKA